MSRKTTIDPNGILEAVGAFAAERGLAVHVVGGYVRDRFLRRKTSDVDVVMEADALAFARDAARRLGWPAPVFYGQFGTAMVETGGVKLEFATCRSESYAEDSRKPAVRPATLAEDLARRDFTINAMARNLATGELSDPFGGRRDLKGKIIRTPVDPDRTFHDDPLRILRGVRFAARFGFEVEPGTFEAMKRAVPRLRIVSEERIAAEILKMLEAAVPSRAFYLLDGIGVLESVLPEISALKERRTEHPCKELFSHTLQTLDNVSGHTRSVDVRLAMLLHDIGKPRTLRVDDGKVSFHRHEFVGERMSQAVCRRLHVGAEQTRFIGRLIRFHLRPHLLAKEDPGDSGLRRFIRDVGREMPALFTIARADLTSANEAKIRDAVRRLTALEARARELNRRDRLSAFRLALDGFAIMKELDLPPSRVVGRIKDALEEKVLDGALPNRKRALRKHLLEHREELLAAAAAGPVRAADAGEPAAEASPGA